jgi:hypothetical protein
MYVVVHHRVTDREKFLATSPREIGGNAPTGVQVPHFLPARDASAADCLWEVESLDALRDYLDPATRDISENTYFEVDSESAMGPPAERIGKGLEGGTAERPRNGTLCFPRTWKSPAYSRRIALSEARRAGGVP